MTYEYRTTVEVDVVVIYGRDEYRPAQTMGPVEACHPAEGGGLIDVIALVGTTLCDEDGLRSILGDDAYAELEDALQNAADEQDLDAESAHDDRRYDEMRDRELKGDEK